MGFYLAYQRLDYVPEPIVCLRNAIITIIENLCKRVGGGWESPLCSIRTRTLTSSNFYMS